MTNARLLPMAGTSKSPTINTAMTQGRYAKASATDTVAMFLSKRHAALDRRALTVRGRWA